MLAAIPARIAKGDWQNGRCRPSSNYCRSITHAAPLSLHAVEILRDRAKLYVLAAQGKPDRQLGERAVQLLRKALALDANTRDRKIWAQAKSEGLPTTELAEDLLNDAQAVSSPLSRDKLDHIIDQLLTLGGNHNP